MTAATRADIAAALRSAGCVFAEEEAEIIASCATSGDDVDTMVKRRSAGVPLEQVVGWARFCGRRIAVEPGVFVPRRRTEFLVQQALSVVRPGAVVVDLCCGSGAIGTALAAAVDDLDLHATDIDPDAVRCARRNLPPDAHVYEGDLYEPLPARLRGSIDVLVANTPYVPTAAISLLPAEARVHERRVALDGGVDGLDLQRRMLGDAARWLSPTGHALVETSEAQAGVIAAFCAEHGLAATVAFSEELDAAVVAARFS